MTSIPQNLRYLPHTLDTRYHAVKTYRGGASVAFICRRYKVSKASLMRWNKRFDGTKDSLKDKSHRPHKTHPKAHTEQEIRWIKNCIRRNPNATLIEIFYKLRANKGYDRHPCSLFRVLRKMGFFKAAETKKEAYVPKPYDTPTKLGIKWQMDVKYVPKHCYTGTMPEKFYQYTVIDEASRERFIYPFKEQSSYSTVQFVKMAIKHFRYKPQIIQTDNGFEFTHFKETKQIHPLDVLCKELGMVHKLIRPRTPRHNGKVERSHRNDNRRFYQHLRFYSYDDLIRQMKRYLYTSNRLPMQSLGWKSPIETRKFLQGASSLEIE
ncbi:DDE-type integrase/transposase/recombinase [Streptococcus respiraculi]|uniref:DDE-type integrase/transposase/recombinase n=1 Tax=Streptococcus respiraculi TaxID=2021971 RepID=UPI000E75500D|nr:DDE-type integrase/transposase/recombinase [Streptococcus respiraculi]